VPNDPKLKIHSNMFHDLHVVVKFGENWPLGSWDFTFFLLFATKLQLVVYKSVQCTHANIKTEIDTHLVFVSG